MSEHRNMILAIVLSAVVLFGWSYITEAWFPAANPPVTKIVDGKQVPVAQPQADPTADAPQAIRDRRQVLAETPRTPPLPVRTTCHSRASDRLRPSARTGPGCAEARPGRKQQWRAGPADAETA